MITQEVEIMCEKSLWFLLESWSKGH